MAKTNPSDEHGKAMLALSHAQSLKITSLEEQAQAEQVYNWSRGQAKAFEEQRKALTQRQRDEIKAIDNAMMPIEKAYKQIADSVKLALSTWFSFQQQEKRQLEAAAAAAFDAGDLEQTTQAMTALAHVPGAVGQSAGVRTTEKVRVHDVYTVMAELAELYRTGRKVPAAMLSILEIEALAVHKLGGKVQGIEVVEVHTPIARGFK